MRSFLCLKFSIGHFWHKNIGAIAVLRILMNLTPELQVQEAICKTFEQKAFRKMKLTPYLLEVI
jgi:hypothetical protein